MAPVIQQMLRSCNDKCLHALTLWQRGCSPIDSSSTQPRLRCLSALRQHQLHRSTLRVGNNSVTPSACVRDLGIYQYFDSDTTTRTHFSRAVSTCFAVLCHICSIHRSVSQQVLQLLVISLVQTWLDYANVMLAGLPSTPLNRLQSEMNAGARHGSWSTSYHCSATSTGYSSLNGLSSSLLLSSSVVCMVQLHGTGMKAVLCGKHQLTMSATTFCIDVSARRSTDSSLHHW